MTTDFNRRRFLQMSLALACAAGLPPAQLAFAGAGKLSLVAAGYRFPRTEALFSGKISVEDCDTVFEEAGIGDINTNLFSGDQRWDFTEIGLHPFMLAYANDGFREYALLPIYPLRLFRHKSIFIRTDRGIEHPEDLKGKRVATPGYSSTSLTWIRGILADEYGVKPEDIEWVLARKDSSVGVSGKASAQESMLPEGIDFVEGPAGFDESELLESGDVDALFHAALPKAFIEGHAKVGRLFTDSRSVEQEYFKKTGIYPIMHVVAVRESLLDSHPWLAEALFRAYSDAKSLAYRKMTSIGWGADMLPWYAQEMEATQALMGKNFYSYGLEGNEKTLDNLFRYSHEQGLSSRRLTIDELFHPAGRSLREA